jgi:hypothetical protein
MQYGEQKHQSLLRTLQHWQDFSAEGLVYWKRCKHNTVQTPLKEEKEATFFLASSWL